MPTNPFKYQEMFPLGKDKTKYRLLSSKYVRIADFEGRKILKIDPRALRTLSREAFHDVEFMACKGTEPTVDEVNHIPEQVLLGFIGSLPESARLIFNMSVFEEMPPGEISEKLGIKYGAVTSQLSRAKTRLASMVRGCWNENA